MLALTEPFAGYEIPPDWVWEWFRASIIIGCTAAGIVAAVVLIAVIYGALKFAGFIRN